MTDPEAIMAAEAAPALPALPALPGVPGEPMAPLAPALPPSRALEWLRGAWRKLTTPTPHTPAEYRGRLVAKAVNRAVDKDLAGPAHDAMLGESVSLVINHLAKGGGGAQTPLGHLGTSVGQVVWAKVEAAGAEPLVPGAA